MRTGGASADTIACRREATSRFRRRDALRLLALSGLTACLLVLMMAVDGEWPVDPKAWHLATAAAGTFAKMPGDGFAPVFRAFGR